MKSGFKQAITDQLFNSDSSLNFTQKAKALVFKLLPIKNMSISTMLALNIRPFYCLLPKAMFLFVYSEHNTAQHVCLKHSGKPLESTVFASKTLKYLLYIIYGYNLELRWKLSCSFHLHLFTMSWTLVSKSAYTICEVCNEINTNVFMSPFIQKSVSRICEPLKQKQLKQLCQTHFYEGPQEHFGSPQKANCN